MKMLSPKWLTMVLLACLSMGITACGDDDEGGTLDNPATAADPKGTVVANLANGNDVLLNGFGRLELTSANNLRFPRENSSFLSVGNVSGLGSISLDNVPENGWSEQVAAVPGYGYIVRHPERYDGGTLVYRYARLYVVDWMESTSGGIMGCTIKSIVS